MNTRGLEECKRILSKGDISTLERRAKRLQELQTIQTDGQLFSSQREWDYAGEASDSYINGNYRSAIFCCACAIDQILRYEYVKAPSSRYEDIQRLTLGQVIGRCKKENVISLAPYLEKAELLKDIRNNVAAHPLFVDLPARSDPERRVRNELLRSDIERLLELVGKLDPSLRRDIESTKLISEAEGRSYVFGEVISRRSEMPTSFNGFWGLIEDEALKFLARQAWNIMKTISEGLYGTEQILSC